jgi:hypothetical protein
VTDLESAAKIMATALTLAFLTESLTEYLFGQLADHVPFLKPIRWAIMYVAAAVGVGVAIFYQLDMISLIIQAPATWVGCVFTGLAIGRGANFVHDFVGRYVMAQ